MISIYDLLNRAREESLNDDAYDRIIKYVEDHGPVVDDTCRTVEIESINISDGLTISEGRAKIEVNR